MNLEKPQQMIDKMNRMQMLDKLQQVMDKMNKALEV